MSNLISHSNSLACMIDVDTVHAYSHIHTNCMQTNRKKKCLHELAQQTCRGTYVLNVSMGSTRAHIHTDNTEFPTVYCAVSQPIHWSVINVVADLLEERLTRD